MSSAPPRFGFVRAIAGPRHHRTLHTPHHQVAQDVLTVLLADVGEVAAAVDDGRSGRVKSSVLVNSAPHCACSRLTTRRSSPSCSSCAPAWTGSAHASRRTPARSRHIRVPAQAQGQLPLTGLDPDRLAQRFVLETARDVDQHVTARKPALAGAVDVGVRRLAEAYVAADVVVPAAEVLSRRAGGGRAAGTARPQMSGSARGTAPACRSHRRGP